MPSSPHRTRREGHSHARFITCSCFQRRPFFNDDASKQLLVDAVDRARERHGFDLWAWVIMPEHFHLVIFPKPRESTLSQILSSVKQSVAKRAIARARRDAPHMLDRMADTRPDGRVIHRFWQRGGGYDRSLWSPREVWEKITYIHANPVGRGLCARPELWPWSSARSYRDTREGLLRIDSERIPTLRETHR